MLPLQTAGVSPSLASLEPFFLYFKFTRIHNSTTQNKKF